MFARNLRLSRKVLSIILMIQDSFVISNLMNWNFSIVGDRLADNLHDDSYTTNPSHCLSYSSIQFNFSEDDVDNIHENVAELKNIR